MAVAFRLSDPSSPVAKGINAMENSANRFSQTRTVFEYRTDEKVRAMPHPVGTDGEEADNKGDERGTYLNQGVCKAGVLSDAWRFHFKYENGDDDRQHAIGEGEQT